MFLVHQDTQCLKEVTFQVTSHEGSVVLSCMTTLELSLIQPCNNLDFIPSSASLITSNADYPRKNKSQKNMQVSRPGQKICSSKEQSHAVLTSNEYSVNQCVVQEDKAKRSKQGCTTEVSLCDDKNCQSTKCNHILPVKSAMKSNHIQSVIRSSYMPSAKLTTLLSS